MSLRGKDLKIPIVAPGFLVVPLIATLIQLPENAEGRFVLFILLVVLLIGNASDTWLLHLIKSNKKFRQQYILGHVILAILCIFFKVTYVGIPAIIIGLYIAYRAVNLEEETKIHK